MQETDDGLPSDPKPPLANVGFLAQKRSQNVNTSNSQHGLFDVLHASMMGV
jgi:hypothetical protein